MEGSYLEAGSSSASYPDITDASAYYTSPNLLGSVRPSRPGMAPNVDSQPQLGDEFGQDTLMGLSEFETFLDAMDMPNPLNDLTAVDSISDMPSAFIAQHNIAKPSPHIDDRSTATDITIKVESATQAYRGVQWAQTSNGNLRYESPKRAWRQIDLSDFLRMRC